MKLSGLTDTELIKYLNGEGISGSRPFDTEDVAAELEARDHDRTDPSAGAAFGHFPS